MMKRTLSLLLIIGTLCCFAACSEDADTSTTVPTTVPSSTTAPTVNPYSMYDEMVAAFTAFNAQSDIEQSIVNIIFKNDTGCYIITDKQKVYPFFAEGATDANRVYENDQFTLHFVSDMEAVMIEAMQNAWSSYLSQCAQNHITVYDRQLYLFTCDYFDGTFGLDRSNQLVQNLILEGQACGKFGPITIFVPDNAGQATPGTMTDGELITLIQSVYSRFATQMELDAEECQAIEYYVFEMDGMYFRVDQDLARLDETAVSSPAMDRSFDGWTVYLPANVDTIPTFNDLNDAHAVFSSLIYDNKPTVKGVADYIYSANNKYYAIDKWNNVSEVSAQKAGKAVHQSPLGGFMIFNKK